MKIGIIGTGLIGGSLAAALKAYTDHQVFCWNRRVEVSQQAVSSKYADKYFNTVTELTTNSDVIIICTPLNTYKELAALISPALTKDKIISDVGSVKLKPTLEVLSELPKNLQWCMVPAHPIAGSEKGGIESANKDLFKNKKLIITKTENTEWAKQNIVSDLWKSLSADVREMEAADHDRIYAKVSHVPQLLSFAYRNVVSNPAFKVEDDSEAYSDFTRLTHSDESLWADIFSYNADAISKALREFKMRLKDNLTAENIPVILAKTLSTILIGEERSYGGTGLKSFLRPLSHDFKFKKQETTYISEFLQAFLKEIENYEKK